MFVVAIDPGQTTGLTLLERLDDEIYIRTWSEVCFESVSDYVIYLLKALNLMRLITGDNANPVGRTLVIEDYRVYESAQGINVGRRMIEAEMIGATRAVGTIKLWQVVSVPAAWKNKWPPARLKARFPSHTCVTGVHARDALRLGLAYFEKELGWTP